MSVYCAKRRHEHVTIVTTMKAQPFLPTKEQILVISTMQSARMHNFFHPAYRANGFNTKCDCNCGKYQHQMPFENVNFAFIFESWYRLSKPHILWEWLVVLYLNDERLTILPTFIYFVYDFGFAFVPSGFNVCSQQCKRPLNEFDISSVELCAYSMSWTSCLSLIVLQFRRILLQIVKCEMKIQHKITRNAFGFHFKATFIIHFEAILKCNGQSESFAEFKTITIVCSGELFMQKMFRRWMKLVWFMGFSGRPMSFSIFCYWQTFSNHAKVQITIFTNIQIWLKLRNRYDCINSLQWMHQM